MSFCDHTLGVDEEKGQNLKQIPDFLVVGAGINGLLVSRNLLALGASVMLIDQVTAVSLAVFTGSYCAGQLGSGILSAASA
jgi:hypothetical protein